jgi:hypothetical protein
MGWPVGAAKPMFGDKAAAIDAWDNNEAKVAHWQPGVSQWALGCLWPCGKSRVGVPAAVWGVARYGRVAGRLRLSG